LFVVRLFGSTDTGPSTTQLEYISQQSSETGTYCIFRLFIL